MSLCRILVIITGILVETIILMAGYVLVGVLNPTCPSMSSFIEVSIAFNGATVIPKARKWFMRSFIKFCMRIVNRRIKETLPSYSEGGSIMFTKMINTILKRFEHRLDKIWWFSALFARLFALAGILSLLVKVPGNVQWLLVALISPFAIAYVCSFVCYLCVRDHLYEIVYDMGGYDEKQKQNEAATVAAILDVLKNSGGKSACPGSGIN